MLVFIQINGPLGSGYGPSFTLSTIPAGVITPSTVSTVDLLNGIIVDVSDGTVAILATSTSDTSCTILITISTTSTTTSTTTTSTTTTTTTVPPVICFAFEAEAVSGTGNLYYEIASSGNILPVNGKPAYDFSGLFGYPASIYYIGTEWVYYNSDLGGIVQVLSSTNNYPISDAVTLPIWTPNCNGCAFSKAINKSTFGTCPTTTTTSTTTTSTTTSTSTTSTSTTSSTSTSTTSSTTSTSSTTTTTTQQSCCSPVINSLVITGPPTGSSYPVQVNYTVPTSGCNTCFSMEFRIDTTGTGTNWNSWSSLPANACTQTSWQIPFQIPNGTLVQLRIISIGGICPPSLPVAFLLPTTTTTTTTLIPPCIPGTNTCSIVVTSNSCSQYGYPYPVAVVLVPPFGGQPGCNQTINYSITGNNCKCVSAVFLDHRCVGCTSWTQGSPVAFTSSGFINICNLLSLYGTLPAVNGFEIRLRVLYTDSSIATSPIYSVLPKVKYRNISGVSQIISYWSNYCTDYVANAVIFPNGEICSHGVLTSFNPLTWQAISYC